MVKINFRLVCLILFAIIFQFIFVPSLQIAFAEQINLNSPQSILQNTNESPNSLDRINEAGSSASMTQDSLILGADKWQNNNTFHMIVIGDSIAWGSGLEQKEKYYYKVADWIQNKLERPVEVTVLAHTGATLNKSQKNANTSRAFTNPDLNSWDPTVSEQADNIKNPENIDLVLLSGGINDVNVNTILNPLTNPDEIRSLCNDIEAPLKTVLVKLLNKCSNSKIIVTSYYPIVSNDTSESALNLFADVLKILDPNSIEARGFNIIKNIYGVNRTIYILSNNSKIFDYQSRLSISKAIEQANQYSVSRFSEKRVAFAPVDFPSNRSYGTEESWLWELTDPQTNNGNLTNDHKYIYRVSLCERTPCDPNDKINAIGHPNVEGANEYNRTIINNIF